MVPSESTTGAAGQGVDDKEHMRTALAEVVEVNLPPGAADFFHGCALERGGAEVCKELLEGLSAHPSV